MTTSLEIPLSEAVNSGIEIHFWPRVRVEIASVESPPSGPEGASLLLYASGQPRGCLSLRGVGARAQQPPLSMANL